MDLEKLLIQPKDSGIYIRLPKDLLKEIRKSASDIGVTTSKIVLLSIIKYLKK